MSQSRNRWIQLTLAAGLAIGASSAAFAHVDVGVNIGVPAVVEAPPPPVYVQPAPVYAPPPPAAVVITPGWYGDRYYDGHRYWERHDWERRHPEWRDARGPHGDRHDNGWHGRDHGDRGDHDH
ncbi:hypothetical protein [Paraburkholderia antibiotica]|uniref:Uncharacterized protein n=1 Tax=Paraburkholderia antibiotica TaxID=2728839 RepID=A0A7X9X4L4_9BURK|nr:hypothetical protein [Paraburkholderia antibiotica]NML31129.1 hypothetical protein [Paraburkholderia antibiotica]